jgi:hypothetical protein
MRTSFGKKREIAVHCCNAARPRDDLSFALRCREDVPQCRNRSSA